ncbi:MAG: hypothetical protein HZC44_07985 [Geobacter sp.]|nr:hypothetical protein [Geobacter sp.]
MIRYVKIVYLLSALAVMPPLPDGWCATLDNVTPSPTAVVEGPQHTTLKALFVSPKATIGLAAANNGSGVARAEYRFDDADPWKTVLGPLPLSQLPEGAHTLFFRSVDPAGTQGQTQSLSFSLDATSPVSSAQVGSPNRTAPSGKTFISALTTITLSASDAMSGVSQIDYRVDGGPWLPFREIFTIANEGEHRLEYRSTDNVGNQDAVHTLSLITDTTPPITSLTSSGRSLDSADALYIRQPTTFELDAVDILSGVASREYRIDEGGWLPYGPFRVDDRTTHVISFRSTDQVGNRETAKSVTIKIDKTPPVTTISVGSPQVTSSSGATMVTDSTFFTLQAEDSQSGVDASEYRLDRGDWLPYSPFTIQEPGEHLIEYRSIDRSGNVETARSKTVTVDSAPPSTVLTVNRQSRQNGDIVTSATASQVSCTATDNNAGVKTVEYKLDSGQWLPCKPFSISAQGAHLVEYRSSDRLGNLEPTRFVKITIDQTPPETRLLIGTPKTVENGVYHISDKTVIAVEAADPLSGVATSEYRISGTSERYGSEPFSIATNGTYRISYWSVDRAGNREKEKSATVTVEAPKPPPAAVVRPPAKEHPADLVGDGASEKQKPQTAQPADSSPMQASDAGMPSDTYSGEYPADTAVPSGPDRTKEYTVIGIINGVVIAVIMLLL